MIELTGYQIFDRIYAGTRTLVYRGIRLCDRQPVAIKVLRNEYPNFSELVQFRNQYAIAKNLNFPGIIQTYSLEPYQNGCALIVEDFGGISLKEWTGKGQTVPSLKEFFPIAIELSNTLDLLCHHRIVHKDIKPANILINPQTKQIKLIDFSISSLLPRETQTLMNPNVLEGTLGYLSPEQTGRMNRGIDYRTDFYSLGVTFYELLAGELPFQSNDPMELVHCQIAKQPRSLQEINPEIPQVLSEIVSKLMAKNAEDRYQSACGLKFDLECCWNQLTETGKIEKFEIARRDLCDRFVIPEKLYGRETEVQTLLQAFDRASSGTTEMMLVSGFSGIGKTVVVNEVYKPIVRQRGYFIKGKFDQFNRNIPFSAFVRAFRDLMGQLLSESDERLANWQEQILQALGDNAQVIIEVIPELENIIGPQLPATELSGNAAQNRFNLLFQNFIKVFAKPEHPLVMFLDDLQWADSASLQLMQLLVSESETSYLLVIGAYRDNEVSPAHPLMLALDAVVKAGATVNTIALEPLSLASLNDLVADTLNCVPDLAKPLTDLVAQKTKGNPFFATQFLKALHQDGLIRFTPPTPTPLCPPLLKGDEIGVAKGGWQCDIVRVREAALTDDVVEFMALQLQKLPSATQNILKLAACIGNQFDLRTLAVVSEQLTTETAADLWKALQEGLILPESETYKFFQSNESKESEETNLDRDLTVSYKFLHDRVQQAAYSLIPENQKTATHYHIGQLLLQQIPPEAREERIFELVNQLNYGTSLIDRSKEREELAQLNLTACRKARAATAYQAAREYGAVGLSLLGENAWQEQYDLALALHELAADVACLNGDFERMEYLIETVVQNAASILDSTKVYEVKCLSYIAQNRQPELIAAILALLEQLGVKFPAQSDPSEFETRLAAIELYLQDRDVQDLVDLPVLTIPEKISAIRLLAKIWPASYQVRPDLSPLIVMEQVYLSLRYGNCELSPFAYATFGLILIGVQGKIELGYQFGQLALKLLPILDAKAIEARTIVVFHNFVSPWKQHLRETLQPFLAGYAIALETGDLEWAGYGLFNYCAHAYFSGVNLAELEQIIDKHIEFTHTIKQEQTLNYLNIFRQAVLNLLGNSTDAEKLIGKAYDGEAKIREYLERDDFYPLFMTYLQQSSLYYLFGKYDRAIEYSLSAEKHVGAVVANIGYSQFYFQDSLIHLANCENLAEPEKEAILARVNSNQDKVKKWAEHAAMNYLHKFNLVEAETYRVLGKNYEAADWYDRAIASANENEYIQDEALANELAAKFYLEWGKEKVAAVYMQSAYYCYAKWGAKAKIDDLETRYPQLLAPILQTQRERPLLGETRLQTVDKSSVSDRTIQTTNSSTSISESLDFGTIFKASQALSSQIKLEQLLPTFLQVVMENAGATKAALLLVEGENLTLAATDNLNESASLRSEPLETNTSLPVTAIDYVKRTLTTVVMDDAAARTDFLADSYLMQQPPKSLLCEPILYRGKLMGLLYLENQLTIGAFTKYRLEVARLLCAQAAISLANARLYEQSRAYARDLERSLLDLQQAQLQMIQNEKMATLGNLVAGIAHEINNPIGFLTNSVNNAEEYIQDLLAHVQCYQQFYPKPAPEVINHAESIDLEFLAEDLPKLIPSMKIAAQRIRDISTTLRTFSRADTAEKVAGNLHEGIDSTLLILKYRLKANEKRPAIEVVKNYGNLPPVKCFFGQLNQVFMNIITNAIDALESSNIGRSFAEIETNPNRITIETSLAGDRVKITIADNGWGMSEPVKERIFDRLFTTKEVGKGTGLGLAIARQIIVEKHGGELEVNSTLGEGSEFVISIPIN
ncbi:MAG: AAA family ATPase [Oscillatoriaceae cyanobacterium Prado104]|jgi:predicted ATPase/signal transduction histidine kinase|nr:AAA family ATPase [Oscillatoriaceae cyanobacterium Prado104]